MEAILPQTAANRAARALAAMPPPPLGGLLAPLDRARSRLLLAIAPRARSLVVDRERRVALAASFLLLSALAGASLVPLWLVAVGPLVWGIPHIVSDVRYLVTRPGYHRRPWILAAMGAGILLAGFGWGLRGGLVGAAAALLLSRAAAWRKLAGLTVIGGVYAVAAWAGPMADLIFAHAHNAVGVGLWWAWRKRSTRLHWVPLVLVAAGATLLLAGAADPLWTRTGGLVARWTGLSGHSLGATLSPIAHGPWPARFLALYAFGQAAHYVVWLRLIPEDDRGSATPRSYTQSFRALRADVGALVMWVAFLGAIALAGWAAVSVGDARNGYIRMAFFHGYLELAAIALLWGEMGSARSPAPATR